MKPDELENALAKHIDRMIARDLVSEFLQIKRDCITATLGRSSPGKFVETVVQLLQFLEKGVYDSKPQVDTYLRELESRPSPLSDDLRICCARIARSCYALRNKRNIAHKGSVNPNFYDLRFAYSCAQWIMSEVVRNVLSSDMSIAGRLIEFLQIPFSPVVENIDSRKIVFGNLTVEKEILVLLHSYYPEYVSRKDIVASIDRRSVSAISNALKRLWMSKLIHKGDSGYKLTQEGYKEANAILSEMES